MICCDSIGTLIPDNAFASTLAILHMSTLQHIGQQAQLINKKGQR